MSARTPDAGPDRDAGAAVSTFAEQLRELRRGQGMPSFTELAKRTGHPRSTLHDALRGDRLPSLEVTRAVVSACGGTEADWYRRWTATARVVEEARSRPPASAGRFRTPEPDPGTGSAVPRRRPWWRRRPRVTALAVIVVVAAVVTLVLVRVGAVSCTPEREYRIDQAGALLGADGVPLGQVGSGDVVLVDNLAHDRFPHRRFATVEGTGARGYIDESKLTFVRTTCP